MPKKKGDRQKYKRNKKDLEFAVHLSALGAPQEEISELLGISRKTLYTHYKKELKDAKRKTHAEIYGNILRLSKVNAAAAIFLCKTQLGMRETDTTATAQEPVTINLKIQAKPEDDAVSVDTAAEKAA